MPEHELHTYLDLAAEADAVWRVLTDFAAYPEWNPFIRSVQGRLEAGARLGIRLHPPGGRPMGFRPVLRRLEAGRELRWLGRLGWPGLFDGEHYFRLDPLPDGGVRFHHGEHFRGWLVPLLRRQLDGPTRAGFQAMNAALKARVESFRP